MSLARPLARPLVRALPHSLIKGGGVASLVNSYREIALRASQTGFGSPVDQSGNFNDPQLNSTLFPPTWQAAQTVAANAYRAPAVPNGFLYKATSGGGGATGASEPTWPTTAGNTVVDGDITWTCERGPWQTRNSTLQIASVRQALLPGNGAYAMPALSWDMANGDSLVVSLRLAWDFANDIRTDTSGALLGTRHASVTRRGFQFNFDGGTLKSLRLFVSDGTTTVGSGISAAAFARKPGDGTLRSSIWMVDGQTKRMHAYADKVLYTQSDMFDGSNLAPNDLNVSAVTGSTATSNNLYLGGVPGGNSIDFGVTALDVMVLPARGLGTADQRQALANYLAKWQ